MKKIIKEINDLIKNEYVGYEIYEVNVNNKIKYQFNLMNYVKDRTLEKSKVFDMLSELIAVITKKLIPTTAPAKLMKLLPIFDKVFDEEIARALKGTIHVQKAS